MKVGDVNGTVTPHSLLGAEAKVKAQVFEIQVEDKFYIKSGEETTVEFKAENFNSIEGYQFSFSIERFRCKRYQQRSIESKMKTISKCQNLEMVM